MKTAPSGTLARSPDAVVLLKVRALDPCKEDIEG